MNTPIEPSLKSNTQIALARLQDRVVEALFSLEPRLIMHGGTAIWRCYNGNRFSDDVDIYATDKQVALLSNELTWALNRRNVKLEYPKYGNTRRFWLFDDFARSKIEAMVPPKRIASVEREYTRANGTNFMINTLSSDNFILEKIHTYQSRMFIRDLYDIYHLANNEKITGKVKAALRSFLKDMQEPIDEGKLKELVYVGVAPTFDGMKASIKGKVG
ncbi:MAG: nucleotidyl transferase AbiEii/AbiGii toxin family protein [Rhabdochlamydiaceae bacterium]